MKLNLVFIKDIAFNKHTKLGIIKSSYTTPMGGFAASLSLLFLFRQKKIITPWAVGTCADNWSAGRLKGRY